MTSPHRDRIIALSDAGVTPARIAALIDMSKGTVYAVLQAERPKRQRAPRARTGVKRAQVLGLLGQGIAAPRVAFLADVSDAYVYRLAAEQKTAAVIE